MSTTFSEDLLRGACLSHGLSGDGSAAELHARLGDFFVRKLLAPETCAPPADVTEKKKGKKRAAAAASEQRPKRATTAWHAFLKAEKELVKASGFHGRVAVLKEVARRYALAKRVNTDAAPLMLQHSAVGSSEEVASETDSSMSDDGLIEALRAELDEAQLNAALAAHGLPVDGDSETKFKSLAQAMLA